MAVGPDSRGSRGPLLHAGAWPACLKMTWSAQLSVRSSLAHVDRARRPETPRRYSPNRQQAVKRIVQPSATISAIPARPSAADQGLPRGEVGRIDVPADCSTRSLVGCHLDRVVGHDPIGHRANAHLIAHDGHVHRLAADVLERGPVGDPAVAAAMPVPAAYARHLFESVWSLRLLLLTHTQPEDQVQILNAGVKNLHFTLEFEPGLQSCLEVGAPGHFAAVVRRIHGRILSGSDWKVNPATQGRC